MNKLRSTNIKEYNVYMTMKARCLNPNCSEFKNYGNRGISVCAHWLESFDNFIIDMGSCPENLTLERRDNDKGYSPDNCYWATKLQQGKNKRNNVLLTHNGKIHHVAEWARIVGFDKRVIHSRLALGWSASDALTIPLNATKLRTVTFKNKSLTYGDWSIITNIPAREISRRILRGWTIERVLTQKMRTRKSLI